MQKVTIWREIEISDEVSEEELIDALKSNQPYTDFLWDNEWVDDTDFDLETEEIMGIDENEGYSTIDLYNDNKDLIWKNGE